LSIDVQAALEEVGDLGAWHITDLLDLRLDRAPKGNISLVPWNGPFLFRCRPTSISSTVNTKCFTFNQALHALQMSMDAGSRDKAQFFLMQVQRSPALSQPILSSWLTSPVPCPLYLCHIFKYIFAGPRSAGVWGPMSAGQNGEGCAWV